MSKKNKNGLTRQGVRDLSNLKGKPRGVRLGPLPVEQFLPECQHSRLRYFPEKNYYECPECGMCGTMFPETDSSK